METKQQNWTTHSQEAKVQKFYGRGVENYADFHGGYLNFGLWEQDNTHYLKAAENLVITLGRLVGLNAKSYLLDIGCGMGPQDVLLHKTFGCTINALDVTWKHILHARARAAKAGYGNKIKVYHGTATKLPFPDNTFTHLISIEAPEHFNTREDFLKEAFRVLKPGGTIGLADYSMERKPNKLWEHIFFEAARILWHVPQANVDDIESYKKKMKHAGFSTISFKKVGARTIPGYYAETRRPQTIKSLEKIRGYFTTHASMIIDYCLLKAYQYGLVEYILVRAEK